MASLISEIDAILRKKQERIVSLMEQLAAAVADDEVDEARAEAAEKAASEARASLEAANQLTAELRAKVKDGEVQTAELQQLIKIWSEESGQTSSADPAAAPVDSVEPEMGQPEEQVPS